MTRKSLTTIVGALSLSALATIGCKSDEKKDEGQSGTQGTQQSCSGKTEEGKTDGTQKSCGGGEKSCGGH
jgi:hypothetical protein